MSKLGKNILRFIKQQPQLFILLIIIIAFSIILGNFTTRSNIMNMLKQSSTLMLLGCGMTFVVISGNLDLSIGSMLSLLLCISIRLQPDNILLAIALPFLIAFAIGAFNGFVIGKFKTNSVVVTLAMMSALAGLTIVYTNGTLARGVSGTAYSVIGTKQVLGIPIYVILVLVVVVGYELLLRKTMFGRSLYYYGVNKEAASIAGISPQRIMIISYVICGISVAMATILLGSRLLAASPVSGVGYEMDALTAILIGGVSLDGGKGRITNTVIGVFLVSVIINGLTLMNVPFEWQNVVKGLLILTAILTDAKVGGRNEK